MTGTARGGDRARRGRTRDGSPTRRRRGAADAPRESWSRGRRRTESREEPEERAEPARATSGRTGAARTRAGAAAARRAERERARARPARDSSRTLTRRRPPAARAEDSGPTRGRYLARRWIAVLAVVSVVVVAYLVMFTSLLGVRSVEVIGVKEIAEADVLAAAAIEPGTPMVRLDADEAAARVAGLPRVFEVVVERSWPSTVEIVVTERTPVAVRRAGKEIHLIDATGLDYAITRTAPRGLPTLAMDDVRPDNPATKAAVTVLTAIPKQLRAKVVTVTAKTPGDVRLTLADRRVIKWGNARDNERKAAVLAPLLTRPGKTYDVATPEFPTVAG
ncbi:cell division protein FtsQ/DivIB [Actinophytocola sp. NPDC049390]|uniref:cell division protein FtsQ/DivIB n=1 Tax=Actinophytocola sp. NPDC049390 TaxID=3363894 RepID=UPI003795225A